MEVARGVLPGRRQPAAARAATARSCATLASYEAYWSRWAEPWEFQALLKARAVAGDTELGAAVRRQRRGTQLWERLFSADDLRSLRHMKARIEAELARKGLTDREVKRGRGGIRDIEFAVQLLQLVHGRLDPELRSPDARSPRWRELAASGYVDGDDAGSLADAYRFLRRVEHVPPAPRRRAGVRHARRRAVAHAHRPHPRLPRRGRGSALGAARPATWRSHQATVRTIHERLYFRPLLEAFASADAELLARPGAVEARLSAFGFSDGDAHPRRRVRADPGPHPHRRASCSRCCRCMLGWLAETPRSRPRPASGCATSSATATRAEELARSVPRVTGGGPAPVPRSSARAG